MNSEWNLIFILDLQEKTCRTTLMKKKWKREGRKAQRGKGKKSIKLGKRNKTKVKERVLREEREKKFEENFLDKKWRGRKGKN